MKKAALLFLVVALFSNACAFNRQTLIDSDPSGAKVYIGGELKGVTPVTTKVSCSTFSPETVLLSKDGRKMQTELTYDWSTQNILWSLLFWPGFLFVGQCPKASYLLELH
jgi:hypothetical protein